MRSKFIKSIGTATGLATASLALVLSSVAHAEQGQCDIQGIACTSEVNLPGGQGVWGGAQTTYRFAVDDTNLSNNFYLDGVSVNDHVASLRDRKQGTVRVCGYTNSGFTGGYVYASFAGVNWVNVGAGTSSLQFRTNASC